MFKKFCKRCCPNTCLTKTTQATRKSWLQLSSPRANAIDTSSSQNFCTNATTTTANESQPQEQQHRHTIDYRLHKECDSTYYPSLNNEKLSIKQQNYDIVIIGSGHNGLVAACYLAKFGGLKVLVLERREVIGGACITEEIFPGYKFSRASYLAGLLRPCVIDELNLKNYPKNNKLKFLQRNPTSFTPTRIDDPLYNGKYLMFYNGSENENKKTFDSIAQFSEKDAINMDIYETYLGDIRSILEPLLDYGPPIPSMDKLAFSQFRDLYNKGYKKQKESNKFESTLLNLYEIMTSPASKILNRYFESEIVKTTLATDAVIGSTMSPNDTGSAYVLLHHIMGQVDGKEGVWAYTQGGMGNITQALKECAIEHGVEIVTNTTVKKISNDNNNECNGVILHDNTFIQADIAVLSNVNPYHTFVDLFDNNNNNDSGINDDFLSQIKTADYQCGAFKINCVVNELPNYECCPNEVDSNGLFIVGDQHKGTTHFESRMRELEKASMEAKQGIPATRPIIEMTIPSSLDKTLITNENGIKNGHHIVQLFVQFAPYQLNKDVMGIESWDDAGGEFKKMFAERVFNIIDEFAPNFKSSVLHADVLSPRDLEKIFGLYKGNIFHGALSLDQLGYARPVKGYSNYATPLKKLYLCGSGAHPGGGVMGAPGRNCARALMTKLKIQKR